MSAFANVDSDIFTGEIRTEPVVREWVAPADLERFMAKVDQAADGCWRWRGAQGRHSGYGRFKFDGFVWMAHRWSYMAFVADIAGGLHIDHLCRVRSCVNPDHLEAVTPGENSRRRSFSQASNQPVCHACGHNLAEVSR